MIRAGDVFFVEQWNGASVRRFAACDEIDGKVANQGYPWEWHFVSKCVVTNRSSDDERLRTLANASKIVTDKRGSVAREQLLRERTLRYTDGAFPSERFESGAGWIRNLVEGGFEGVSIISSRAGSIRSNHWHKTDHHHLYVVTGRMLYWETPWETFESGSAPPKPYCCEPGSMIFTDSQEVHATAFLEDTVLVSISKLRRDHVSHEKDVERVEFVTPQHVTTVAPWVDWG